MNTKLPARPIVPPAPAFEAPPVHCGRASHFDYQTPLSSLPVDRAPGAATPDRFHVEQVAEELGQGCAGARRLSCRAIEFGHLCNGRRPESITFPRAARKGGARSCLYTSLGLPSAGPRGRIADGSTHNSKPSGRTRPCRSWPKRTWSKRTWPKRTWPKWMRFPIRPVPRPFAHCRLDPVQTTKTNIVRAIIILMRARRLAISILPASTSEVYGEPTVQSKRNDYWGTINPIGSRSRHAEPLAAGTTESEGYLPRSAARHRKAKDRLNEGPPSHNNEALSQAHDRFYGVQKRSGRDAPMSSPFNTRC